MVKLPQWRSLPVAGVLILAIAVGSAACASSGGSTTKKVKIGLVTDIGGLNDRSYNALAFQGLRQAESQLGVGGRVLVSKSGSDYVPNLAALAQQRYDLVVGVGFLMADAVATVARKFPRTKFALIDVDQSTLKDKPGNVLGLIFKSEQGGYLAGYLAGEYAKGHGIGTISTVGGQKIPPVDAWIAGFQAGAKAADPAIKILSAYSQSFVDQAACKELALDQISRGSKILFQAAGQCGLGAMDAAKSKGVYAVGVDADQRYLGDFVMTSAIKKVDVAVLSAARDVRNGTVRMGRNLVFDLSNDGTGIGGVASYAARYLTRVDAVAAKIKSGAISVPSAGR